MKRLLLFLSLLLGSVAANAQLVPPSFPTQTRFLVTYPITFYIDPAGSDQNPCTQESPCATAQNVYSNIINSFDMGGQTVTIQFADGTYNSGVTSASGSGIISAASPVGGGTIIFQGNISDNTKVIFQCATDCWHFSVSSATTFQFSNISTSVGSGANEYFFNGSVNALMTNIYLNGGGHYGVLAQNGAFVTFSGGWNFDGTWSGTRYGFSDGSVLASYYHATITLDSSTPTTNAASTFNYFVSAIQGTVTAANFTFVLAAGSYTGARYIARLYGLIDTSASCPAAYFPGSTSGSSGTGTCQ